MACLTILDMDRARAVYEIKTGTPRDYNEDTLYAIGAARRFQSAPTFAEFVSENGIAIIQGVA